MKFLGLLVFIVLLMACATSPTVAPHVAPDTITASAPAALTIPSNTEGESVVQKLASKVGLDSDRDEIIEFTRAALTIEARRNALIAQLDRWTHFDVNRYFVNGIPAPIAEGNGFQPLEGTLTLRNRLLLVDSPQSLEPIKDSLVHVYNTEIDLAMLQSYSYGDGRIEESFVAPGVTKDNVEQYGKSRNYTEVYPEWLETQRFRKQIYTRWSEILVEQGIDPAEEGFRELVPSLMSDIMQDVMKGLSPEHQKKLAERHGVRTP
jgi:hypothetical protein